MSEPEERGQVGIGTLIVFIAMVLVAAIAAGVLINTAGFLQSKSEQTGEQSSQQVTNRLQTVSTTGIVQDTSTDNPTIEEVNMTVKKAPGADDIDLANVTIQYIGPDGTTTLVAGMSSEFTLRPGANFQQGFFNASTVKDADGSASVLNTPDDRLEIGVDLGQPETTLAPLEPGETATLTLTTASGGSTEVRIEAPQSLTEETAVNL
jgi:flagellin-like protein